MRSSYCCRIAETSLCSGRFEEAARAAIEFAQLEPASAHAHYMAGTALGQLGRHAEAVGYLKRCTELRPDYAPAFCNLGLALEDLGRTSEAADALQRALKLSPDSETIAFHLGAISGENPPPKCPRDYVIELFDAYAGHFEDHLVAGLDYRAPKLVADAVVARRPRGELDVLDLGCGTGLCGQHLRPRARRLVGVDLSAKMIEVCLRKGIYNELHCADVSDFLRSQQRIWDVIAAVDLFIYIGDLEEIFSSVSAAMRPRGSFAFTIETIDAGRSFLRPTRRYAHGHGYIDELAAKNGFSCITAEPIVLRRNPDVAGAIIVLSIG